MEVREGSQCSDGDVSNSPSDQNELDNAITAFTAPMPNKNIILTDYEAGKKAKNKRR